MTNSQDIVVFWSLGGHGTLKFCLTAPCQCNLKNYPCLWVAWQWKLAINWEPQPDQVWWTLPISVYNCSAKCERCVLKLEWYAGTTLKKYGPSFKNEVNIYWAASLDTEIEIGGIGNWNETYIAQGLHIYIVGACRLHSTSQSWWMCRGSVTMVSGYSSQWCRKIAQCHRIDMVSLNGTKMVQFSFKAITSKFIPSLPQPLHYVCFFGYHQCKMHWLQSKMAFVPILYSSNLIFDLSLIRLLLSSSQIPS